MTSVPSPVFDPAAIAAWCREAAAGDHEAVEKLLWVYHGRLTGFLMRRIGPELQGRIDPDDVLQDAYIRIVDGIREFVYQDEDSFYHWASRIVERKFVDHVRRVRRKKRDMAREVARPHASSSRHVTLLDRCLADSTTPSRILRREEAVVALMSGIAQLPEDYRHVIQRLYLNEEPLNRIAADMGRSEDAVRRLASRAVERLNASLRRATEFRIEK